MTAKSQSSLPASSRNSRFIMSERNLGLMMEIIRKDPESYRELIANVWDCITGGKIYWATLLRTRIQLGALFYGKHAYDSKEFQEQFDHYLHTMKLLHLQPQQHRMELQPLLDSVMFLSGLAKYFKKDAKEFSSTMMVVLREQAAGLDQHVRMAFVKALVMLRNQNLLDPMELMELFFELMRVEDKHLRKFILGAISSHLKRLFIRKRDQKLVGKIQNFVFAKMKDSRAIIARAAQLVAIDAFRQKYWRDAKTANVIAEACFHKIPKIQVTAMKFFLGSKKNEEGGSSDSEDDSDGEDDGPTIKEAMTAFRHAKKTRKRTKDLEKTKKAMNKKKKSKKDGRSKECNLLAIQSLFDPQEFVDRVYGMLEGKKVEKFEVRLFRIALCARIIGVHRLHTLGFYSYLYRYLQPKQREVTRILLYAAQACHELVPPDTVEQLVRTIANNFVSDRNSPEAMTVGINAIREILSNCPFAATEELLRDLAEYKTYKNKNVSMSARALITLFRAVNPKLLARKDRGRPEDRGEDDEKEFVGFADPIVADFVSGAEVLDEDREDTGDVMNAEMNSDSEIDVSDIDTDDVNTDSEDDVPPKKKTRKSLEAGDNGEGDEEEDDNDDGWIEVDDEDEDEDDDDEDGWETASDEEMEDEDEETEETGEGAKKEKPMSEKQARKIARMNAQKETEEKLDVKKKADNISTGRILTQEEFKLIREYQLKKQLIGEKRLKKQLGTAKSQTDYRLIEEQMEKINNRGQGDGLPRLRDIEYFHKKQKQTKEERLASVLEGRDEDRVFGKPKKTGPHVGRTNRELAKKKVFSMVKQKVRGKNRQRSFRDQQKSLRDYLLKQAGGKTAN